MHVMQDSTRAVYDLESLWALGEKFDSKMTLDSNDMAILKDLIQDEFAAKGEEVDFDSIFKKR